MTIDWHTRRHKYNDMKKKINKEYSKRTNYFDTKANQSEKWILMIFSHTFQYNVLHLYTFNVYWKKERERESGRDHGAEICHSNGMWYDFAVGRRKRKKRANKTVLKTKNWSTDSIHIFDILLRLNFHWKIYPVKCQQKWNKIKENKKQ